MVLSFPHLLEVGFCPFASNNDYEGGNYEWGDRLTKIDIDAIFGNFETKIDCHYCKKQFNVKMKKVFDDGKKVKCPSCRKDVSDKLDKKTKDALLKIDKEIKSL